MSWDISHSQRRIHVAVVVPTLRHGGSERVAARLSTLFADHGEILVTLIVFDGRSPSYPLGGEVITIDEPADLAQGALPRLTRVLRRARKISTLSRQQNFDVVYSIGDSANLAASFSSSGPRRLISFRGYRSVALPTSWRARARRRATIGWLARRAHGIVSVSEGISRTLEGSYGQPSGKVHTIPNGYDTAEYARLRGMPLGPEADARPRYLVAIGTYKDEKRYDHLLRSFARAPLPPEVILRVYGSDPTGQREQLAHLARELGIHHRVELHDFTDEPWREVRRAEALLLSSEFEGFPNMLVEGMLCAVPVIATDCTTGPREILMADPGALPEQISGLIEGDYGLLVPPPPPRAGTEGDVSLRSETAFAEAMAAVVNDPQSQSRWARLALTGAERYSMERWEAAHVDLFRKCAEGA